MDLIQFIFLVSLFYGAKAEIRGSRENSTFLNDKRVVYISDEPADCIFVTSQTGSLSYLSTSNSETVCAIYLMTESHNLIEVTFTEFDVPCKTVNDRQNLVQYVDGWELNGEIFPNTLEESYSPEQNEFCSENTPLRKTLRSSQNGAQILYKIPLVGARFTIFVEHKKHPLPCNVIHIDEPYYLLENHGRKINCSIWTPYPMNFKFNSYRVGNPTSAQSSVHEFSQCADHIEIGGGGLDTNRIEVLNYICDASNNDGDQEESINCSSTTIKLVSTGNYRNHLNISMISISSDEQLREKAKYQCGSLV